MNKRIALLVACLALLCVVALSLVPLNALAVSSISFASPPSLIGVSLWQVRDNKADASTAVTLKAAPGTGYRLYVTRVLISCKTATAVYLQDEDANVIAGGYEFTTTAPAFLDINFPFPRKLTANKALTYKAGGAGNITIEVEGYTAP